MDAGKGIVIVLFLAVIGSEVVLVRQNAQLKRWVAAENAAARKGATAGVQVERAAYEASMMGRCQPFYAAKTAAAATRPITVSLFFSLDHDCTSCVHDLIEQWNGVLQRNPGAALAVQGYTTIDGTVARRKLEEEFKPAFPVTNVPDLSAKLTSMDVRSTPVVFVSDAASGRILSSSSPPAGEKISPAVAERIQALLQPCAE